MHFTSKKYHYYHRVHTLHVVVLYIYPALVSLVITRTTSSSTSSSSSAAVTNHEPSHPHHHHIQNNIQKMCSHIKRSFVMCIIIPSHAKPYIIHNVKRRKVYGRKEWNKTAKIRKKIARSIKKNCWRTDDEWKKIIIRIIFLCSLFLRALHIHDPSVLEHEIKGLKVHISYPLSMLGNCS
jgi:hypothetical protein